MKLRNKAALVVKKKQENPPAHRDEEVKETIDAFLVDFDDIVRSGENCLPGIAMRLYDLGWRKQEVNHETEN